MIIRPLNVGDWIEVRYSEGEAVHYGLLVKLPPNPVSDPKVTVQLLRKNNPALGFNAMPKRIHRDFVRSICHPLIHYVDQVSEREQYVLNIERGEEIVKRIVLPV
jgi:hypothetical protein